MTKRGDMFKRIFTLLEEGHNVDAVINMGYSKSTVYWASQQRKDGKKPDVTPGSQQDWVATGLNDGWMHRCEDGPPVILVNQEIQTTEGIAKQLVCPRCKKVVASHFDKWTPDGKVSYDTRREGQTNIAKQFTMKKF